MKRIQHFDLNGSTSNPQNIVEPQGSYYQAGGDVKSLVRSQCTKTRELCSVMNWVWHMIFFLDTSHFMPLYHWNCCNLKSKKMTQNLMTQQDCVSHLPLRFLLPFQRVCWHNPCTWANLHLKGTSHTQDVKLWRYGRRDCREVHGVVDSRSQFNLRKMKVLNQGTEDEKSYVQIVELREREAVRVDHVI